MPMSFPDFKSLIRTGELHQFRPPEDGEREAEYRRALADHVEGRDVVESMEIRTGHGWDAFSPEENLEMIKRIAARNGR